MELQYGYGYWNSITVRLLVDGGQVYGGVCFFFLTWSFSPFLFLAQEQDFDAVVGVFAAAVGAIGWP